MPADRPSFAVALRRGLGRCVIEARASTSPSPSPYGPLVIAACRHHQAYDPQSEGLRTRYLLELAEATGVESDVLTATVEALPVADGSWDADQLVDLARAFACDGDARAREALVAQVKLAPASHDAAAALADADGEAGLVDEDMGLLFAARLLGERDDEGDAWVARSLVEDASTWFGAGAVEEALTRAALASPALERFRELARPPEPAHAARPAPGDATLERLLDDVRTTREKRLNPRGIVLTWGRRASPAELARLAEVLTDERLPEDQEVLLAAFVRANFPGPPERLFALARSDRSMTSQDAFRALKHLSHPAIRPFALACLAERPLRWGALSLFGKNGVPGDGRFVREVLDGVPDDDDEVHAVSLSLLDGRPEGAPGDAWAAPLAWLYEHTPCSVCRRHAIEALVEGDTLDPAMRAECRYDCDLDTRALVREGGGRAPAAGHEPTTRGR